MTNPHPISTIDGCRIGGSGGFIGNCPGPCPSYNIAADADPSNPTATFQRGSYHRVVWARNNHEGGFSRWSIVPITKMYSKEWHSKMAFHYTCWNVGRFNCNEFDFHRDCNYDRDNQAFSKMLYIPPIYPDGVYVLAFTWYGGGIGSGHFGDYYDCAYIRIAGGEEIAEEFIPNFVAGGGSFYEDGCEATVDTLGICWKEPCVPERKTSKYVPREFSNGSHPPPVQSSWFSDNFQEAPKSIELESLMLIDAKENRVLFSNLKDIVQLNRNDEISLLAVTSGDVKYVEWYTNGKLNGRDYYMPFTISGDSEEDFFPWMHPVFNRRLRIAVKVVGKDHSLTWGNFELRFEQTNGSGAENIYGMSWKEFQQSRNAGVSPNSSTVPNVQVNIQSSSGTSIGTMSTSSSSGDSEDFENQVSVDEDITTGSKRGKAYSLLIDSRFSILLEQNDHIKRSTADFS